MKGLPVAGHLSHEEIDRRYRRCTDAAEKSRWHVLWLVTRPDDPLSATTAAKLVGFTPAWGRAIHEWFSAEQRAALRAEYKHADAIARRLGELSAAPRAFATRPGGRTAEGRC
ncbi:hypothetical protein J0H58_24020 [bacterium]|nr:hypothetical protein [bacterium]